MTQLEIIDDIIYNITGIILMVNLHSNVLLHD